MNAGGVAAIVDYVGESKGNVRLPGIMMLGYVGAHSENLAMAVIVSKVCDLWYNLRKFQETRFYTCTLQVVLIPDLWKKYEAQIS